MKKILLFTLYYRVQKPEDHDIGRVCMSKYDTMVFSNARPFTNNRLRIICIYMEYLRQAIHALKKRKVYDGYVFLEPQIGLLYAFLSRIFCLKTTKIILINFIPREQHSIQRLIDMFYRFSLDRITAMSVSSRGLMDVYARRFCTKTRQFFIPDAIHFNRADPCTVEKFIFSGGYSHRDWHTLLKAAEILPDLKFTIYATISSRAIFDQYNTNNLLIKYDVSNHEFYNTLRRATLVVVPLQNPNVAAGQLLIVHALHYGKSVIAARTVGTTEYIDDGINGMLYTPGDNLELAQKIKELMTSLKTRERLKDSAIKSARTYTQEHYAQNVLVVISSIIV